MATKKSSDNSTEKENKSKTVTKNGTRKKTVSSPKKRTSRRTGTRRASSPKIKLDKGRVKILSGIIFLFCCIVLAINVLTLDDSANLQNKPSQNQSGSSNSKIEKIEKIEKKQNIEKIEKPRKKQEQSSQKEKSAYTNASGGVNGTQGADSSNQNSIKITPAVPKSNSPAKKPSDGLSEAQKSAANKTAPVKQTSQTAASLSGSSDLSGVSAVSDKTIVASAKKDSGDGSITVPPPKKSPEAAGKFNIPAAVNGAKIVIIIDDAGLNVENTRKYTNLPFPITIAVLPKLSHSKDCAYLVRSSGKELILHQPMQSLNHNLNPGPGKITVDMSFDQIHSVINENLKEIGPGVKGLNNHEGSEVTEDVLRIGAVLDACMENNIYFLDSRTTVNTKAPQAALERDFKIYEKAGPYIDNEISREAMLKELYKALDFANKNGKAIIIGHVDKSAKILPKLLEEMYPYLIKAGYTFATPSML